MIEHEFTIESHGETIRGVLWTPDAASRAPLILTGHGFGQHKRVLYPPTLAADLTARGFCLAVIDAPEHGDRRSGEPAAIGAAWGTYWSTHGASLIRAEYSAMIDALAQRPEVDASRIGYFGLSLATQYGIGVLAGEERITRRRARPILARRSRPPHAPLRPSCRLPRLLHPAARRRNPPCRPRTSALRPARLTRKRRYTHRPAATSRCRTDVRRSVRLLASKTCPSL